VNKIFEKISQSKKNKAQNIIMKVLFKEIGKEGTCMKWLDDAWNDQMTEMSITITLGGVKAAIRLQSFWPIKSQINEIWNLK